MSVRLAVLLACVPAIAQAGSHCHEVSHVVGYERCSRFGAWSMGGGLQLELGAMMQRFSPGSIDAVASRDGTAYELTRAPGDHRALVAEGVRMRNSVSLGRGYFGMELDVAHITDGPQLVAQAVARGATMEGSTTGVLVQGKIVLGFREEIGGVALGLELAPGIRGAGFTSEALAMSVPSQIWALVEVHARAETWLSPHISLAGELGTNLLEAGDLGAGLAIGLHLTPYDGLR